QRFPVRYEVAHAHAFAPREAAGLRDVSAKGDRVIEARYERIHGHEVAVADRAGEPAHVEREFLDLARLVVLDALDGGFLPRGGGGKASRPADEVEEHRALPQLVDRGNIDAAGDGDERPHRRDVDHVARKELRVPGLVAGEKQIVQVELGGDLVAALQLDVAHRALARRSAGGEYRGHQRAERAHRVGAGALRLS